MVCRQSNPKLNKTFKFDFASITKRVFYLGTCGMFDWSLFDNSNWTKVVWRPKKLGCLAQIKFDWQFSNIKLIKLNQKGDYVQLILISMLVVEQNINQTKSGKWLRSINVMFDECYVQ
jgi:hypothetical protein